MKLGSRFPSLKEFPLKSYALEFSMDGLVSGVDNFRIDVHLSSGFKRAVRSISLRLIARCLKAEEVLPNEEGSSWVREKEEFQRVYRSIMLESVSRTKLERNIQIDLLAQVAVTKLIVDSIPEQYEVFIQNFKEMIRKHEKGYKRNLSGKSMWIGDSNYKKDLRQVIRLKERMSDLRLKRKSVLRKVGREISSYLEEIQKGHLKAIREDNFGTKSVLPEEFLLNPILFADQSIDDFFMIEEYVLLGHRFEEPNRYDTVLSLLKQIFSRIQGSPGRGTVEETEGENTNSPCLNFDALIGEVENIDTLVDLFRNKERTITLKEKQGSKEEIRDLKVLIKKQKQVLNFIYREFKRTGLIKRVCGSYELLQHYQHYCPPMPLQQLLQYLVDPSSRKMITSKLKNMKKPDGREIRQDYLDKMVGNLDKMGPKQKKKLLIRFLKDFARYHRDLRNRDILTGAFEMINLTSDEKVMKLSSANNTLYEFLLEDETVEREKPVMNHTIIKADVRGSTEITNQMKKRGLNPASYFSLNFFDPVTDVLFKYGAAKVFIEGDALILSICEKQDRAENWYSVARSCGLAINMLSIIKRYNANTKRYNLPTLELGIGICFDNAPPDFLFDGEKRIMISPAINLADRLSGCEKSLRVYYAKNKSPFNVHVFEPSSVVEFEAPTEDMFIRYNVNGIELNRSGFEKLSGEIDLRRTECSIKDIQEEKVTIYTGKFPTVNGNHQRLVIREAKVMRFSPEELKIEGQTERNYYEVSTNPRLYEYVKGI